MNPPIDRAAPTSGPRVYIVTGAASGVGAATALKLARAGARLLLNFNRSADLAAAVLQACRAAGADAHLLQGDIADDAVCRALAREAVQRWGRIDGLVHSAGTTRFVALADLEGVSAQDFQQLFGVNTVAAFQLARAAAPHMGPGSAMVCVSSSSTLSGNGSSLPYVVSKAALNGLTLGLARALAPKVRVNAVLPGLIEGRWMRDGLGDETYQKVKSRYAEGALLERVATPEDIAAAIAWLLDPACLMTGQLMVVDGGFGLGKPPAATGGR
ncbi:MAG: SDR family oxidoreductase [Burkholderiales bacterium]|nr:SDR family oxidoreductase [Burkholderiales bacterium]